jgi:hypothetical protein
MLRSRRSTLGPQLARHGIAIDHAVLDDEQRHLVDRRRRGGAGTRLGRALKKLDESLSDLEHASAGKAR